MNVRYALSLDRVILEVANEPWQKLGLREVTPAADRLAMVEAAVAGLDGIEAGRHEIDRGGPSYTVDTLSELRAAEPACELFLILGSDAAAGIQTWENAELVSTLASIVVVERPGEPESELPDGFTWIRVEVPRLEVSSTDLRDRIRTGRPLDYLLPAGVRDILAKRPTLYGGGE